MWAFHHMDRTNPHAHIMLTTRAVGETGFAGKVRDWNDRALAETWRASWADHANRALANAGYQEEIDHRSYERQGLEKAPGLHPWERLPVRWKNGEWKQNAVSRTV
nr:MobA/MobL family protein [Escherichia coli]